MRRAVICTLAPLVVAGALAADSGGASRVQAEAFVTTGSLGRHLRAATTASADARRHGRLTVKGISVRFGLVRAQVDTGPTPAASATARARTVDLLDGLVTAYGVRRKGTVVAGTPVYEGAVKGLRIDGQLVGDVNADRGFPLPGEAGTVVANHEGEGLRVTLSKDFHGYPAGTSVALAVVVLAAPRGLPTPVASPTPTPLPTVDVAAREAARRAAARRRAAERMRRRLTAPGLGFPVFGPATAANDYGAPRADVGKHEGNDIFAPFGAPVVAVADGRLNRVGTLPISGNRLWLKTAKGDAFFYAHLSSFAPQAVSGRFVKAGTLLGFVGNTGDAEPTPPHLHFEIHPLDRAPIDPHPILVAWQAHGPIASSSLLARYGAEAGERPGALVELRDFIAEQ